MDECKPLMLGGADAGGALLADTWRFDVGTERQGLPLAQLERFVWDRGCA